VHGVMVKTLHPKQGVQGSNLHGTCLIIGGTTKVAGVPTWLAHVAAIFVAFCGEVASAMC